MAIQSRRSEMGFASQEALAEAAGVGLSTIGRLERGQRVSTVKEADIERALQWETGSIQSLFEGTDPKPLGDTPAEPDPLDYPDEYEYMDAVYWYLRRTMSHEAVMRGFNMAAAIYMKRRTQGDQANAERDNTRPSG